MAFAIYENENSKITWIDVTSPTSPELSELSKKYSLNHFAISDCLEPDHLPKHEDIDGTHFIMTRSLLPTRNGQPISIQSISTKIAFFYRDGLLVTIHRIPHDFIVDVRKRHFDEDNFHSVEEIVAKLLWYVLHSYEIPAVRLSTELDDFENKVFSQNITPQILSELYQIKRNALMSKKLLLFSQEAVSSVKIKNNDTGALQDTRDLHLKLLNIYDQIHEDVSNLVNFYLSISAQKTNEVIKVLTIFSVFFMPLTFIAGIYGMNFEYMPELKVRWGYPILLIIMILLSGLIYLWFKKKKWL